MLRQISSLKLFALFDKDNNVMENAARVWCVPGRAGRETDSFAPASSEVLLCRAVIFKCCLDNPEQGGCFEAGHTSPRSASSQPAGNRKGLFSFFFFSCLRLNIQMVLWAEYSGCMNVYIRGPKVPRFLCLWPKEHCVLTLCPFASGGSRDTWRSFWLCPGSHQTPTP